MVDPCGNYNNTSGVLISPGFPYKYQDEIECIYKLSVEDNNIIKIFFSEFDLEFDNDLDCFLESLGITYTAYEKALRTSDRGKVVILNPEGVLVDQEVQYSDFQFSFGQVEQIQTRDLIRSIQF